MAGSPQACRRGSRPGRHLRKIEAEPARAAAGPAGNEVPATGLTHRLGATELEKNRDPI
jgi:hypothetical protein